MTPPIPDPDRFELLSAWCDGSISEAQVERLNELLRIDPEFRKFFIDYTDQHAVLAANVLPRWSSEPSEPPLEVAFGQESGTLRLEPGQGSARPSRRFRLSWTLALTTSLASAALVLLGVFCARLPA